MVVLSVGGSLGMMPGVALGESGDEHNGGSQDDAAAGTSSSAGAASTTSAHTTSAVAAEVLVDHPASPAEDGSAAPADAGADDSAQPLPPDSGSGRRVVYDVSAQRVWLVTADGRVQRTYLVSGAVQEDKLAPGSYEVFSKSRRAVALNYRETMRYMVRFAEGSRAAIGFHDIPVHRNGDPVQARAELGTPQSGGCIRQARPDAKALWDFTEVGTTVVVVA